jgi:hypothetical protein
MARITMSGGLVFRHVAAFEWADQSPSHDRAAAVAALQEWAFLRRRTAVQHEL